MFAFCKRARFMLAKKHVNGSLDEVPVLQLLEPLFKNNELGFDCEDVVLECVAARIGSFNRWVGAGGTWWCQCQLWLRCWCLSSRPCDCAGAAGLMEGFLGQCVLPDAAPFAQIVLAISLPVLAGPCLATQGSWRARAIPATGPMVEVCTRDHD